jgi:hypothetical protein
MKTFYAVLCLAIASLTQLQAQAPQGFNYQATVRNSEGNLVVNSYVYFKFNVVQGSLTAVPIFTETHFVSTDDLGQVSLVIGEGTANTGVFSEIDWSLGSYYLGIALDTDTGNGYLAMGTTQLLSVPYALHAKTAETADYNNLSNLPVLSGTSFNPMYPDNLIGYTSIFENTSTYAVPAGKNLHIKFIYAVSNDNIMVDGTEIFPIPNYGGSFRNLILSAGSVITTSGNYDFKIEGYVTDASVEPITIINSFPYTVPEGKILYISEYKSYYNNGSFDQLKTSILINGVEFQTELNGAGVEKPFIISSGHTLSDPSSTSYFLNGFLR